MIRFLSYWGHLFAITMLLVVLGLLLGGCATDADLRLQADLLKGQLDLQRQYAQQAQVPLVELEAPIQTDNGTQMLKLRVANPHRITPQPIQLPPTAAQEAKEAFQTVIRSAAAVWTGKIVVDGMEGLGKHALSTQAGVAQGGFAAATSGVSTVVGAMPDPVIVTQPDPVIVTQPDPVIVDPVIMPAPDPIIVPAPDPIIVPPTIVQTPDPIIVNPVVIQP